MAAATCYTYTGAIRKKLREMSGVQLRHQYVLCNTKKKIKGLNNKQQMTFIMLLIVQPETSSCVK
jgi:hypothetical protein